VLRGYLLLTSRGREMVLILRMEPRRERRADGEFSYLVSIQNWEIRSRAEIQR